jgi:putative membrane protein
LAYERTMLAWVRTGTSLITFGIAIYSFDRIVTREESKSYSVGLHQVALMMVVIGLVALLLATFEYRLSIHVLTAQCPDIRRSQLPAALAISVSALGILALIVIILRLY